MKKKNSKKGPYHLGNLVVDKKQSHEIMSFLENGKFAACSCSRRHPLNERAREAFLNGSLISDFEYWTETEEIMLKKGIENISK